MNELQIFKNESFGEVRTIIINNEPWFVGKDVCKVFGDSNYRRSLERLDEEEKGVSQIETRGGKQKMIVINESGLYSLLFYMQPQKAKGVSQNDDLINERISKLKEFKRWVTSEVLPSIRKHGAYMTAEKLEEVILNPDMMIKLCTALKEEKDRNKELQLINSNLAVDNNIMKPKAEYFDELVDRNLLTNFRETAKQLHIGEKSFIKFLIDKKYLYRDKRGKLMPYADKNKGLFEMKECFNEKTQWSGTQTLVTPKGRETFRLLYAEV